MCNAFYVKGIPEFVRGGGGGQIGTLFVQGVGSVPPLPLCIIRDIWGMGGCCTPPPPGKVEKVVGTGGLERPLIQWTTSYFCQFCNIRPFLSTDYQLYLIKNNCSSHAKPPQNHCHVYLCKLVRKYNNQLAQVKPRLTHSLKQVEVADSRLRWQVVDRLLHQGKLNPIKPLPNIHH